MTLEGLDVLQTNAVLLHTVEGFTVGNVIEFSAVVDPALAGGEPQMPMRFKGVMSGVKLEGTLTLPDGTDGSWEGWWTR